MTLPARVGARLAHPRLAAIAVVGLALALLGGLSWGAGNPVGRRLFFVGGVVAAFGLTGLVAFAAFDPD